MEREQLKSVLESLFFASEGPLTPAQLGEILTGVERKEIVSAVEELISEYDAAGRGFRLTEVAGGYQLRTARENAEWVKKLYREKPARMTRATLETLAIIAYRQPITRAEIEAVRGVDVDGVVATLLERRLIRIVARKDIPGRPFLYGTTPEFLELFNLKDLSHLPTLKEMEEMAAPPPPDPEAQPLNREG
ncbi:MAG: SMC-Scp complex subunit ScpB [Deltaproteobacteria bacterium RIFCSPLOWO2_12_FULL_60_19]|nr:MAG: SMC-Scp complex subunit ScpB [Deltaproteobacteria bacterium RIFCSPLOWO2_12_FULL_60_19]